MIKYKGHLKFPPPIPHPPPPHPPSPQNKKRKSVFTIVCECGIKSHWKSLSYSLSTTAIAHFRPVLIHLHVLIMPTENLFLHSAVQTSGVSPSLAHQEHLAMQSMLPQEVLAM